MTGLELATKIRALEDRSKASRCPIVALTASAMPHEIAACLEHGMDDVVLKPFAFEKLKAMLDKWCHEESSQPT
jgi:CheY-like chemotaxis protein